MESNEFNFKALVDLVLARWKVLIVVALIGGAAGAIVSMPYFMPPRYMSVAVAYPVNTVKYSDESETEQLLQVFEASSVRDSIIEKFDLYTRYDLERGTPEARYYLLGEYNDRFVVRKTLYESVRLEVYDEDPQIARDMASEVLRLVNKKFNELANERGRNLAKSYKMQMDYQQSIIDSVDNLLNALSSSKGLMDYQAQSRELVRGYVESIKGGSNSARKELEDMMANAQEAGNTMVMLQQLTRVSVDRRSEVERGHLFWREFAFRDINYIDVIVEPEVADKKAWPTRWLIVLLSTGAAVLLAMVLIALSSSARRL